MKKFTLIITSVAALLSIASCNKEKAVESEISVFEFYFTDNAGSTYSSSKLLYGMEREDFSPTIYAEGGRIWVKGSEDSKSVQEKIDQGIAFCNEKVEELGEFSSRKYTPVWNPDAGTKGLVSPLDSIEFSKEELQELKKQLMSVPAKYPHSGIRGERIGLLFDKMIDPESRHKADKILVIGLLQYIVYHIMPMPGAADMQVQYIWCVEELVDVLFKFCEKKVSEPTPSENS